jgi:hypothetical protein
VAVQTDGRRPFVVQGKRGHEWNGMPWCTVTGKKEKEKKEETFNFLFVALNDQAGCKGTRAMPN